MTRADYDKNKQWVRDFDADYLCELGGELSEAYLDRVPPVRGALEATTSGLNILRDREISFPFSTGTALLTRIALRSDST
jgi:hypothetical protein